MPASTSGFLATIFAFGRRIGSVVQALEKKMSSEIATKRDLQQLEAEFAREFTIRTGLILVVAVALFVRTAEYPLNRGRAE